MSEAHRYRVVKMLTENANRISYDPHGPEVVLASDYDALAQLCRDLEHSLEVKEEFYQDALHSHIGLASQRDALRAEVKQLQQQVGTLQSDANSWQSGYDKGRHDGDRFAREEREALRKDAERYRWLRKRNWNEAPLCVVARPKDAVKLGYDCPSLDRLDTAIDAAMEVAQCPSDTAGDTPEA